MGASGGRAPGNRRGAKSRANLKRGGIQQHLARKTPAQRAAQKEIEDQGKAICARLVNDPRYEQSLRDRLFSGRCQPGVEVSVQHMGWGKPVDKVETKQVTPVKIVHEYAEEKE